MHWVQRQITSHWYIYTIDNLMMFLLEIKVFLMCLGSEAATSNIKWGFAIISALYFPHINLDNTWNKFCCLKGYLFMYSHNKIFQIFNLIMGRNLFSLFFLSGFGSELLTLCLSQQQPSSKAKAQLHGYHLLLHKGIRTSMGF